MAQVRMVGVEPDWRCCSRSVMQFVQGRSFGVASCHTILLRSRGLPGSKCGKHGSVKAFPGFCSRCGRWRNERPAARRWRA